MVRRRAAVRCGRDVGCRSARHPLASASSVRSRFLALLLVLSIWPATGETLEYVVHWAQYGDTAHAAGDQHGRAPIGTGEHGCSGMFHLCSCHAASQVAMPSPVPMPPRLVPDGERDALASRERRGCEAPAPLIRPPIA